MTENQVFLISLLALLAIDLLTVAAGTAFLHANLLRLASKHDQAPDKPSSMQRIFHSLPRIQAGFSFTLLVERFVAAGLMAMLVMKAFPRVSIGGVLGCLLLAALLTFWLEWLVKRLVVGNADLWALRLAFWARALSVTLAPLVGFTFRAFGADNASLESSVALTTDELKTLVDAGQQEGLFQQEESKMIFSIFELGDTLAREIMVPRIDILALDANTSILHAVDILLESGHSRVPVYQENVDNILGLLYVKDLLRIYQEGNRESALSELLRPAYFIPEAKKIDELLAEMQEQRIHMAIVVDEYGGVAGLVTMEDIVEEILGEIQDEYDQGEELPYQQVGDGEYLFQGRVDLDDFNEVFSSHLPKDEAETLGGFIYNRIGRVPSSGETVQVENLLLTVEQVSARRIRKVRAKWAPATSVNEEDVKHVGG
ncbi:MAG: transporter associated domain-containing protein [Anaerolineales bacterium]|nr:transporter associated domain-containing protein [Anaerolineales bacterium]